MKYPCAVHWIYWILMFLIFICIHEIILFISDLPDNLVIYFIILLGSFLTVQQWSVVLDNNTLIINQLFEKTRIPIDAIREVTIVTSKRPWFSPYGKAHIVIRYNSYDSVNIMTDNPDLFYRLINRSSRSIPPVK